MVLEKPLVTGPVPESTMINSRISVYWCDNDVWEQGCITSRISLCFYAVEYDFLVEGGSKQTVSPRNLLGLKRPKWYFI